MDWESIIGQSKANGGEYTGEDLPSYRWQWPKSWLQARIALVKDREAHGGKPTQEQAEEK